MHDERMTGAVSALLADRELEADEALAARFDLTAAELETVRRGDVDELVAAGLDPELVWPAETTVPQALRLALLRNVRRFGPAALVAAALLVPAPAAVARKRTAPRGLLGCAVRGICRGVRPPVGSVTYSKQELADACKDGGFAEIGAANQGDCVSLIEQEFPDGITLVGTGDVS